MHVKKKVIILGGGVAGMSAAHELIERGFEVSVYEFK
jgi:15-cis-phytoene desaturase